MSEGRCSVQDVAAGLVVALALAPQHGEDVLDCCAAPGGKALFFASLMKGQVRLTARIVSCFVQVGIGLSGCNRSKILHMICCMCEAYRRLQLALERQVLGSAVLWDREDILS